MKAAMSGRRGAGRRGPAGGKTRRVTVVGVLATLVLLWLLGVTVWHFGDPSSLFFSSVKKETPQVPLDETIKVSSPEMGNVDISQRLPAPEDTIENGEEKKPEGGLDSPSGPHDVVEDEAKVGEIDASQFLDKAEDGKVLGTEEKEEERGREIQKEIEIKMAAKEAGWGDEGGDEGKGEMRNMGESETGEAVDKGVAEKEQGDSSRGGENLGLSEELEKGEKGRSRVGVTFGDEKEEASEEGLPKTLENIRSEKERRQREEEGFGDEEEGEKVIATGGRGSGRDSKMSGNGWDEEENEEGQNARNDGRQVVDDEEGGLGENERKEKERIEEDMRNEIGGRESFERAKLRFSRKMLPDFRGNEDDFSKVKLEKESGFGRGQTAGNGMDMEGREGVDQAGDAEDGDEAGAGDKVRGTREALEVRERALGEEEDESDGQSENGRGGFSSRGREYRGASQMQEDEEKEGFPSRRGQEVEEQEEHTADIPKEVGETRRRTRIPVDGAGERNVEDEGEWRKGLVDEDGVGNGAGGEKGGEGQQGEEGDRAGAGVRVGDGEREGEDIGVKVEDGGSVDDDDDFEGEAEGNLRKSLIGSNDVKIQEAKIAGEGEEHDEEPERLSIPGSSIKDAAEVIRVEETLHCLSHEGRWIYNSAPRWLPWDLNPLDNPEHPNYQTCDELFVKESGGVYGEKAEMARIHGRTWKVREALLYEWHTVGHGCSFEQFNREGFCQVIGGRNVVVVGDSFSLDFHDALLNHLVTAKQRSTSGWLADAWGKHIRQPCHLEGHQLCTDVQGAAGGFELRVVLNPFLTPDTGEPSWHNKRWVHKLKEWNTGVLVLNRGSRFRETEELLRDVRETLTAVRTLFPDLLIIWRNTAGGHPSCHVHWAPLSERMDPKNVVFPLNWHRHPEQNEAIQPLLKEFGVVYMDIETATSLRPDGHHVRFDGTVDCHHYCMPGPLDHWVSMFYNVLLQLERGKSEKELEEEEEAEGKETGGGDSFRREGTVRAITPHHLDDDERRGEATSKGEDSIGSEEKGNKETWREGRTEVVDEEERGRGLLPGTNKNTQFQMGMRQERAEGNVERRDQEDAFDFTERNRGFEGQGLERGAEQERILKVGGEKWEAGEGEEEGKRFVKGKPLGDKSGASERENEREDEDNDEDLEGREKGRSETNERGNEWTAEKSNVSEEKVEGEEAERQGVGEKRVTIVTERGGREEDETRQRVVTGEGKEEMEEKEWREALERSRNSKNEDIPEGDMVTTVDSEREVADVRDADDSDFGDARKSGQEEAKSTTGEAEESSDSRLQGLLGKEIDMGGGVRERIREDGERDVDGGVNDAKKGEQESESSTSGEGGNRSSRMNDSQVNEMELRGVVVGEEGAETVRGVGGEEDEGGAQSSWRETADGGDAIRGGEGVLGKGDGVIIGGESDVRGREDEGGQAAGKGTGGDDEVGKGDVKDVGDVGGDEASQEKETGEEKEKQPEPMNQDQSLQLDGGSTSQPLEKSGDSQESLIGAEGAKQGNSTEEEGSSAENSSSRQETGGDVMEGKVEVSDVNVGDVVREAKEDEAVGEKRVEDADAEQVQGQREAAEKIGEAESNVKSIDNSGNTGFGELTAINASGNATETAVTGPQGDKQGSLLSEAGVLPESKEEEGKTVVHDASEDIEFLEVQPATKEGGADEVKGEGEGAKDGEKGKSSASSEGLPAKVSRPPVANATKFSAYIPGTNVNSPEQVQSVERTLSCFSSEGRWVYNKTPRWVPWDLNPQDHRQQPDYKSCDIDHKKHHGGVYGEDADKEWKKGESGKWRVRREIKYEWRTKSCNFEQFNRERFCREVGKRNIVIVGDAAQLQLHDAMLNHLVTSETRAAAGWLGDARANKSEGACALRGHQLCGDILGGEGVNVRVVRNNLLSPDKAGGGGANNKWLRQLGKWNADIVILNRGAVYRPMGVFVEQLREMLEKLRSTYPEVLILWRNTPQGHPECGKYVEALKKPLVNITGQNWEHYPAQNDAAKQLMKEYGAVYVDVATPTALRPDGHHLLPDGTRDCVNYCSPGPIDQWVTLIYNTILTLNRHSSSPKSAVKA